MLSMHLASVDFGSMFHFFASMFSAHSMSVYPAETSG